MEYNRHISDFRCDMTLEFDVKHNSPAEISEADYAFEYETGTFTNEYAQKCFNEINKHNYKWLKDWSFSGRSNGWFVLMCDEHKLLEKTIDRIESIVNKYLSNYNKELEKFYNENK